MYSWEECLQPYESEVVFGTSEKERYKEANLMNSNQREGELENLEVEDGTDASSERG